MQAQYHADPGRVRTRPKHQRIPAKAPAMQMARLRQALQDARVQAQVHLATAPPPHPGGHRYPGASHGYVSRYAAALSCQSGRHARGRGAMPRWASPHHAVRREGGGILVEGSLAPLVSIFPPSDRSSQMGEDNFDNIYIRYFAYMIYVIPYLQIFIIKLRCRRIPSLLAFGLTGTGSPVSSRRCKVKRVGYDMCTIDL